MAKGDHSKVKRKFSSFFKSLVIELDKELYGPDNHLVEVGIRSVYFFKSTKVCFVTAFFNMKTKAFKQHSRRQSFQTYYVNNN